MSFEVGARNSDVASYAWFTLSFVISVDYTSSSCSSYTDTLKMLCAVHLALFRVCRKESLSRRNCSLAYLLPTLISVCWRPEITKVLNCCSGAL